MNENIDTTPEIADLTDRNDKLLDLTDKQAREIDKLNFENLALWKLMEERGLEDKAKRAVQDELKNLEEYLQSRHVCNIPNCNEKVAYRVGLILKERQGGKGVVMEPHFSVCPDHVKKLNITFFRKTGDWEYITNALKSKFNPSSLFSELYYVDRIGSKVAKEDL